MKLSLQLLAIVSGLVVVGCLIQSGVFRSADGVAPEPKPPRHAESGNRPPRAREYVHLKDRSILVWIPGGTFVMGRQDGDSDEKPAHEISVKGFWLGKYEVTNEQYAAFLKSKKRSKPMYWETPGYDGPKQPVVGLTWQNAKAYADWAGLRLPTEAEWEYAARAGKRIRYGTVDGGLSHDLANYRGREGKDKWDGPAPVGSFSSNPLGLYDMAGNAWEWTSSLYKPYPYSATDGREDTNRSRGLRVMRGGAWHFPPDYLTVTHRHRFASHLQYDYCGFRVAMSSGS